MNLTSFHIVQADLCVISKSVYQCFLSECISFLGIGLLAGSTYSVLSTMPSDSESSSSLSSVGMYNITALYVMPD